MILSYDGTAYFGWQIQKNAKSIQETIEKALFTILREKTNVVASGRTDKGVHAKAQVCHFIVENEIDVKKTIYILNRILDADIRILKIEEVDSSFHARYSASAKVYHYNLCLKEFQDPFSRLYAYKPFEPLDINLLKKAAKLFIGKKDFTSFSNKPNEGSCKNNPVRNLSRLDVIKTEHSIRLEYEEDGLLYKMVRNITGTLLDVATKKISLKDIANIFKGKDRQLVNKSAAAHGLFLAKVFYSNLSSGKSSIEEK